MNKDRAEWGKSWTLSECPLPFPTGERTMAETAKAGKLTWKPFSPSLSLSDISESLRMGGGARNNSGVTNWGRRRSRLSRSAGVARKKTSEIVCPRRRKRSTSMGHTSWRCLNAPVNSIQSLRSNVDRDSRSAMELNIPGKWEADKEMLRVSHQEVIWEETGERERDLVPPQLFT